MLSPKIRYMFIVQKRARWQVQMTLSLNANLFQCWMHTKEAEIWLQLSLDEVFVWKGQLCLALLSDIYETVIRVQHVVGDLCSILKEMGFFSLQKNNYTGNNFSLWLRKKNPWFGLKLFSTIIDVSIGEKHVTDRPSIETFIS